MPCTFLTPQAFERPRGPVDQLEDRYLGMVEAVGSNPTRSTLHGFASGPEDHLSESRSRDELIGTTALASVPRLPGDLAGELRVSRLSSRSGLTILKAPKPVAVVRGGRHG